MVRARPAPDIISDYNPVMFTPGPEPLRALSPKDGNNRNFKCGSDVHRAAVVANE